MIKILSLLMRWQGFFYNGNLTKDSNKNISTITYNCLNLPSKVTFSDGCTITYSCAADGTKLRTVHTINGTTTQKDYCANVVYENGVQKMLLTEEGYVDLSASTLPYYYYLKDHQGNNRVVVSSGGTVAEVNHYYPFGGIVVRADHIHPRNTTSQHSDGDRQSAGTILEKSPNAKFRILFNGKYYNY